MKKFLLSFFLVFVALASSFAQSPDKVSIGTVFISAYPSVPLPNDFETYIILQDGSPVDMDSPADELRLISPRFSPTNNIKAADVIISVYNLADDVMPAKPQSNGRRDEPLFKSCHWRSLKADVTVSTSSGEALFIRQLSKSVPYESDWVPSREEAVRISRDMCERAHSDANLNSLFSDYNKELNEVLGSGPMASFRGHVYGVKADKKNASAFADLNKAASDFKAAFKLVSKNDYALQPFIAKAQPSLSVWTRHQAQISSGSSTLNAELRAAVFYNLGVYNMLIKNFSAAEDFFNKALSQKKKFADASDMALQMKLCRKAQQHFHQQFPASDLK